MHLVIFLFFVFLPPSFRRFSHPSASPFIRLSFPLYSLFIFLAIPSFYLDLSIFTLLLLSIYSCIFMHSYASFHLHSVVDPSFYILIFLFILLSSVIPHILLSVLLPILSVHPLYSSSICPSVRHFFFLCSVSDCWLLAGIDSLAFSCRLDEFNWINSKWIQGAGKCSNHFRRKSNNSVRPIREFPSPGR